jgi:hypothetical protein
MFMMPAIDIGLMKLKQKLERKLWLLVAEDLLVRNLPEIGPGQPFGHSPLWLLSSHSGDLAIRYSVQRLPEGSTGFGRTHSSD